MIQRKCNSDEAIVIYLSSSGGHPVPFPTFTVGSFFTIEWPEREDAE